MRVPALALAAVLTLGTLAACGPEDDDTTATAGDPATSGATTGTTDGTHDTSPGTWPADASLTEEEARDAVLTLEDLSTEFVVSPEDDDDSDADLGCFGEIGEDLDDDLGEDEADDESNDIAADYEADGDFGLPLVSQYISADAEGADHAGAIMDRLVEEFETCTSIDETDDGVRMQLDLSTDADAWADGADQQVNIVATGTMGTEGLTFPMTFHMTFVRVDDMVTMLMFFDMAREAGDTNELLVDTASARLAALVSGEEPAPVKPLLEDYPIGAALEGIDSGQHDV